MNIMKIEKWLLPCCLLLISVGIATISRAVLAVTVDHYKQKGGVAEASWYQDDGCTTSFVYVSAYEIVTTTPGSTGSSTLYASLSTSAYNYCIGASSFSSGETTSGIEFTIDKTKSATLTGTIPTYGCDFDGSTCGNHIDSLDLEWTATGAESHVQSVFHGQYPTGMSMFRSIGTQSPATAVGIINRDGTLDLVSGNSQFGSLSNNQDGSLSIVRP